MTEIKLNNVSTNGIVNLLCGTFEKARKDYIKGYIALYKEFGKVPDYEEYDDWKVMQVKPKSNTKERYALNMKIGLFDNYYDSLRFIKENPYEIFIGQEQEILDDWTARAEEQIKLKKKA